jgi:PPOX class probable F420-dependent enzyme
LTDISDFARLVPLDHGLCVVSTLRTDGTVQSSVANGGVLPHPLSSDPVVALVAMGNSRKLENLRRTPRATIVVRAGFQWVAVEGPTQLIGPDDRLAGIDHERLRMLLRDIFTAAGGRHDNWDDYDATMAREQRVAVLTTPERVYSNG